MRPNKNGLPAGDTRARLAQPLDRLTTTAAKVHRVKKHAGVPDEVAEVVVSLKGTNNRYREIAIHALSCS